MATSLSILYSGVRRHLVASSAGAALLLAAASSRADNPPPRMDWDKPVRCLEDGKKQQWRVQCDADTKVCIYAPDAEVDTEGKRLRPLDRVPECSDYAPFDQEALKRDGYRLEQGLPPTPYGWYRDRFGKVFQFNFDLHKRMFLGGGWSPEVSGGEVNKKRSLIEFGLLEWQSYDGTERNPTRHRLRLVEGEVRLAPFSATGFLARYDFSHRRLDPLVRVTTFFGEPRRSDYRMNLGLFFEAGGLDVRETTQGNTTLWKYGTANVTVDLWQSRDLYSFLRVRGGGLVERIFSERRDVTDRVGITPNAAIEADFTLDQNGFHHLLGTATFERPQYVSQSGTERKNFATRARGEISYEVIALALNDQPISLRLATAASRRDDVPGLPSGWTYTATAGLRFSLWAPAREP